MTTYITTLELKTPWYKKLLRFLHFIKPAEYLKISAPYMYYKPGDLIKSKIGLVKVIGKAA